MAGGGGTGGGEGVGDKFSSSLRRVVVVVGRASSDCRTSVGEEAEATGSGGRGGGGGEGDGVKRTGFDEMNSKDRRLVDDAGWFAGRDDDLSCCR